MMSAQDLNKLIEQTLTDKALNGQLQKANQEVEQLKQRLAEKLLGRYDLTADEREAVIAKDTPTLMALGVSAKLLKRADWCTGD
jgi:hypothetical protein